MCVVALCHDEESRLTEEIAEQMFSANPSGAGVAWRETIDDGGKAKVVVKWEKGLELDRFIELVRTVPVPYLSHCRIPTCGGSIKVLCHPFPVSPQANLNLRGETSGFVLAHNGHWSNWEDKIIGIAERTGIKLPGGAWSDTRAMAWATAVMGPGYLDMKIKEKAVLFGPKEFYIISPHSNAWTRTTEGILVSNMGWRHVRSGVGWTQVRGRDAQDKEEPSRTSNRVPSNSASAQTGDTDVSHGPADPSWVCGKCRLLNNANSLDCVGPGCTGQRPAHNLSDPHQDLRSPFGKGGRVLRRITPAMMAGWEEQHRLKNHQGHPLLSKKKIKKYRAAFEQQQKEDQRQEIEARIARAQENFARASIFH